jgi:hypothetical protein
MRLAAFVNLSRLFSTANERITGRLPASCAPFYNFLPGMKII